ARVIRTSHGRPNEMERDLLDDRCLVCGIDEVGRGAWAGPLVVGVAVGDPSRVGPLLLRGPQGKSGPYADSKALAPLRRIRIASKLRELLDAVGIGVVEVREIDQLGMAEALRLACSRALSQVDDVAFSVEIDGPSAYVPPRYVPHTRAIVGGDSHSPMIAAASIVAKVHRDQLMVDADDSYPMFDFARNKGYPSPFHRRALLGWGPSTFHRVSWKPFDELVFTHAELLKGRLRSRDGNGGLHD
ncbi:MAG: ribonuclease HII, partial [Acidimicrobiales bacterium]